ncbi:MAG: GNAT family N-acetyltransferase [Paramuribaculum sp.]|nr:GNAT family N-acetyltransferase [Paramuribaculum sp.]
MRFERIVEDKKKYLDLLLLADEQEDMIDRYIDRGEMWTLDDGDIRGVCVVTDEGEGVLEIKNLAVATEYQRRGYGKAMIEFISKHYNNYTKLRVGTGDSPLTVPFYVSCGFKETGRITNFFTDNYDHPIWEGGVLLKDMVILERCV